MGYVDWAEPGPPARGQPPHTIELKYTLYGDTNLDGTVDSLDFIRFLQHYGTRSGGTWADGDFNYDGSVNFLDLTVLELNYTSGAGGPGHGKHGRHF